MNKQHINQINKLPCWHGKIEIASLSGGMTNHNYKVRNGIKNYVVRIGTDIPEHLLWRENEGQVSLTAAQCGFAPEVVHRESGILVIDFIEGKVFSEDDVKIPENMQRLVSLLKRFHHQMPSQFQGYTILFWVFQVLRHYRNMLEQKNSPYMKMLPELMEIASALEAAVGPVEIVFGHNDLLAANFIDDGDKIWLIDFDYAGFNSPLFDLSNLASNSELDEALERTMLSSYFDKEVDDQLWHSYNAMKCASLLRETMWSMVSEIYSTVDFDFSQYTQENKSRFDRVYQQYSQVFG